MKTLFIGGLADGEIHDVPKDINFYVVYIGDNSLLDRPTITPPTITMADTSRYKKIYLRDNKGENYPVMIPIDDPEINIIQKLLQNYKP